MEQKKTRVAWTAPELKSVEIATTAGKDFTFSREFAFGTGVVGPS